MKKKYVLKKWVKDVLNILVVIAFMLMLYLAFRITPEEEARFNYCVSLGNSVAECKKNVLGIYGG